ncbi:uncharacterized protein LOC108915375 [Anoplophora glabripennis]|uniref:uncharacterized protein LOC108915375 n=1 Tax=Anoplophora glabripennis TaxID=217634 RepID=UPI000875051F|nr:uncharacterized protein LOC108915375 [Anoplophora glabripennis]
MEDSNYVDNTKLDRLINLLIEVKVQQEIISERLGNIEAFLEKTMTINSGNIACHELENCLIKFPFQDVASIQEFDNKLKDNEKLQQSMLNYLQFIGGTTNKLCINRCLEKVFTNFVGQFCCWTGKRGNLNVSDLKMIYIVRPKTKNILHF